MDNELTPEDMQQQAITTRLEILDGIVEALDRRHDVFTIASEAADLDEARRNLVAEFGWSHHQAQAVLDLQLLRLNVQMRDRIAAERSWIRADIGLD